MDRGPHRGTGSKAFDDDGQSYLTGRLSSRVSATDVISLVGEKPRTAPRRRVLKTGSISFGGGSIDCTARNISDTGAALEVVTPLFIPDRFKLIIPSEKPKPAVSRRVRRTDFRIGLAFD
jgi:hypothetical protein